jgi:leader peptidase (prepilin peptidase)/N-methyltransferase
MEAILLGLLGLAVGTALSPLVTSLAAWPEGEAGAEWRAGVPAYHGEAGSVRPLALALAHPRQATLLALTTAVIFVVAGLRYDDAGQTAIVLAYASALVVCAATDLVSFRVPNSVTYPAIAGALAVAAFMPHVSVGTALAGGVLGGGILLVLSIASRGGIGLGDVKLATFAGLALGWPLIFMALLITALAGGIASALALLLRLRRPTDPIPYAPFIAAAAIAVMLWLGSAIHEL